MTAKDVEDLGTHFITESCCEYMLLWEFDGKEIWPDETIGAEYFEADDDYMDAATSGATYLRIGSKIFGQRD